MVNNVVFQDLDWMQICLKAHLVIVTNHTLTNPYRLHMSKTNKKTILVQFFVNKRVEHLLVNDNAYVSIMLRNITFHHRKICRCYSNTLPWIAHCKTGFGRLDQQVESLGIPCTSSPVLLSWRYQVVLVYSLKCVAHVY
jgi:hypothetical protein